MTKYPYLDMPDGNEFGFPHTETAAPEDSISFPGSQYFNEIMLEKIQPERIAPSRISGKFKRDF